MYDRSLMIDRNIPSLVLGLLLMVLLITHEASKFPDGCMHVDVFDVGQGDAIFLTTPSGKQVLVDGGPDLSLLEHLGKAMSFLDRSIDLLVLTHPHKDHLTALPEILKRYNVGEILLADVKHDSGRYRLLLDKVLATNTPVTFAHTSRTIQFDDGVVIEILWPLQSGVGAEKNPNNTSIVTRIAYKDHSMLLTGDIEEKTEAALLATGMDIQSTILKVAHHGSKSSSSTGFLLAANPVEAVRSYGSNNRFEHPHGEVISRLVDLGIPYKETAKSGTVSYIFE